MSPHFSYNSVPSIIAKQESMNISLMKLGKQDIDKFIELIQLFEAVFEMEDFTLPDKEHLQVVLEKKDFVAFVAMDEIPLNSIIPVNHLLSFMILPLEQFTSEMVLGKI